MKARKNPFRTDRVSEIRYRPQGRTWDELLSRLTELRYRAAIVGPDGSGKTTLLEDLAPRLEERGLAPKSVFLNDRSPLPPGHSLREWFANLHAKDVVLLDGADLMSPLAWRRFKNGTAAAGGLIITSHRAGLLPTLVTTRATIELLKRIVEDILGERDADLWPRMPALFRRHDGNVREVLRALYDEWASLDDGGQPGGTAQSVGHTGATATIAGDPPASGRGGETVVDDPARKGGELPCLFREQLAT